MKTERITGGCLCGQLRYEATAKPDYMGYCFCEDCRKASGSGFVPFMGFAVETVKISGDVLTHTLRQPDGRTSDRNSCPQCGSLVFGGLIGQSSGHTIYAGSLDEVRHFRPTMAIFASRRPAWVAMPAGLTKVFDEMPTS